jgi:pyruvate dehydrogenase E1 component
MPYDPTFAHEVAVIMHDGLKRMVEQQEDVFYYITVMNENYPQPGLQAGQEQDILKGLYLFKDGGKDGAKKGAKGNRVQLMGSGTILREVIAAADLLKNDWGVTADIWSAPSFTLLARDGQDVERWNMLHPTHEPRVAHITKSLQGTSGPIVVATDYMRTFAEQVRAFVPKDRTYKVLGTDGFGRSDSRAKLREFFEVNRYFVTIAALKALADEGAIAASVVADAITKYSINPDKANPVTQ